MKKDYKTPRLERFGDLHTPSATPHVADVESAYPYTPARSEYASAPPSYARAEPFPHMCEGFCGACANRLERVSAEIDDGTREPFDPEFMYLTEKKQLRQIQDLEKQHPTVTPSSAIITTIICALFGIILVTAVKILITFITRG